MDSESNSIESVGSEINLKICVLGDTLVGKTAIINRFINNAFSNEHDKTIEEQYTKYSVIDNVDCIFDIKDTGGQEEYQTTLDTWIKTSDAFILVYSVDSYESFEGVKTRYEKIINKKDKKKLSLIIAGNKCDINDRKVDKTEVENFCNENKINFIEVSAMKEINISEVFFDVARQLLKNKYKKRVKQIKKQEKKNKGFCIFC